MGAAENTRAGAAGYEHAMDQIGAEVGTLAEKLENALTLVSDNGPIGRSQNQDLIQVRSYIAIAWQRAKEADEHAQQSKTPVRTFADRVFPG